MVKSIEVGVIENIQKKLSEKFPDLIKFAREEFISFNEDLLNNPHLGQFFYGWCFGVFSLYDGKKIPGLCFEILDLDKNEEILLKNIQNAIPGFFGVLKVKTDAIFLEDMLTKRKYVVKAIDLDFMPKKGDCLEAVLVKSLKGDYFFFGGFQIRNEKRGIELNLLEYARDLTIDELVERELGIINRMEQAGQEDALINYLIEVLDFNYKDAQKFLKLPKDKQEEMIKDKIIGFVSMEYDG